MIIEGYTQKMKKNRGKAVPVTKLQITTNNEKKSHKSFSPLRLENDWGNAPLRADMRLPDSSRY